MLLRSREQRPGKWEVEEQTGLRCCTTQREDHGVHPLTSRGTSWEPNEVQNTPWHLTSPLRRPKQHVGFCPCPSLGGPAVGLSPSPPRATPATFKAKLLLAEFLGVEQGTVLKSLPSNLHTCPSSYLVHRLIALHSDFVVQLSGRLHLDFLSELHERLYIAGFPGHFSNVLLQLKMIHTCWRTFYPVNISLGLWTPLSLLWTAAMLHVILYVNGQEWHLFLSDWAGDSGQRRHGPADRCIEQVGGIFPIIEFMKTPLSLCTWYLVIWYLFSIYRMPFVYQALLEVLETVLGKFLPSHSLRSVLREGLQSKMLYTTAWSLSSVFL